MNYFRIPQHCIENESLRVRHAKNWVIPPVHSLSKTHLQQDLQAANTQDLAVKISRILATIKKKSSMLLTILTPKLRLHQRSKCGPQILLATQQLYLKTNNVKRKKRRRKMKAVAVLLTLTCHRTPMKEIEKPKRRLESES